MTGKDFKKPYSGRVTTRDNIIILKNPQQFEIRTPLFLYFSVIFRTEIFKLYITYKRLKNTRSYVNDLIVEIKINVVFNVRWIICFFLC